MKNFNDFFGKGIKKERSISQEAREGLDEAYRQLAQKKHPAKQKKRWRRGGLLAAALLLVGIFLFEHTPIGEAITNLLRFDQFTSKTLTTGGFVTQQSVSANSEQSTIRLQEVYADQNSIGLHFSLELTEAKILPLDETLQYGLHFALINGDGVCLVDNNSGLQDLRLSELSPTAISEKQQVDRRTRTVELTYRISISAAKMPKLTDAEVRVTQITATPAPTAAAGLQKDSVQSIFGKWRLPIDSANRRTFDPIVFEAAEGTAVEVLRATAYPSSFVLELANTKRLKKLYPKDSLQLIAKENGAKKSYRWHSTTLEKKNGKEYLRITFDYSAYDQYRSLTIPLADGAQITLTQK